MRILTFPPPFLGKRKLIKKNPKKTPQIAGNKPAAAAIYNLYASLRRHARSY